MTSIFYGLIALISVTRLIELNISKRHRAQLLERGARAIRERAFSFMVIVHVAILLGCILEVALLDRVAPLWLGLVAALSVVLANALRLWAISSLGMHWNVQVVDSTAMGIVSRGPYRFIRHPNYVAVFAELTFLPLVHGAWITALVGTALHIVVLYRRITLEEAMLMNDPDYREIMGRKPRFLPV